MEGVETKLAQPTHIRLDFLRRLSPLWRGLRHLLLQLPHVMYSETPKTIPVMEGVETSINFALVDNFEILRRLSPLWRGLRHVISTLLELVSKNSEDYPRYGGG